MAFNTTSLEGLHEALNNTRLYKQPYRQRIYDCREYSAGLNQYLYMYNFDSGLMTISYPDGGHRIVWVRLANETVFVEPQLDCIYTMDDLMLLYPNATRLTLHHYDVEVSRDKVIVLEN